MGISRALPICALFLFVAPPLLGQQTPQPPAATRVAPPECRLCTAKNDVLRSLLCEPCSVKKPHARCARCMEVTELFDELVCVPCQLRNSHFEECASCAAAGDLQESCSSGKHRDLRNAEETPLCREHVAEFEKHAGHPCFCHGSGWLCPDCTKRALAMQRSAPCPDCLLASARARHGCMHCAVRQAVQVIRKPCEHSLELDKECESCLNVTRKLEGACPMCEQRKAAAAERGET